MSARTSIDGGQRRDSLENKPGTRARSRSGLKAYEALKQARSRNLTVGSSGVNASPPRSWIRDRMASMCRCLLRGILRVLLLVIGVLLVSGWFGAMTGHAPHIVEAVSKASESTTVAVSQWIQVASILLQSAHGVWQAAYSWGAPLALAFWPYIRPVFDGLLSHVLEPLWQFMLPWIHAGLAKCKAILVGAGAALWERIITANPETIALCLGALVGSMLLIWLQRRIARMQLSQRLYNWIGSWANKVNLRIKAVRDRVYSQLATHSQVAARVVRVLSLFLTPLAMFALVLLARRSAPSLIKRLGGSAEMIFLFVVLPCIFPANIALRSNSHNGILLWLRYAVAAASLVLLWRVLPFTQHIEAFLPLIPEAKLSLALWVILAPTNGALRVIDLVDLFISRSLPVMGSNQQVAYNDNFRRLSGLLFFLSQRHRDLLSTVMQDGSVLAFMIFFPAPSLMAKIGFLLAGTAYPIFRSIAVLSAPEHSRTEQCRSWLVYWVLFGLSQSSAEALIGRGAAWIPFYWHAWLLFVIFLQLPYFRGATWLYDSFYQTILVKPKSAAPSPMPSPVAESPGSPVQESSNPPTSEPIKQD